MSKFLGFMSNINGFITVLGTVSDQEFVQVQLDEATSELLKNLGSAKSKASVNELLLTSLPNAFKNAYGILDDVKNEKGRNGNNKEQDCAQNGFLDVLWTNQSKGFPGNPSPFHHPSGHY